MCSLRFTLLTLLLLRLPFTRHSCHPHWMCCHSVTLHSGHMTYYSVHAERSFSVALKVSYLFYPEKFVLVSLWVVPDMMWGQRSGMSYVYRLLSPPRGGCDLWFWAVQNKLNWIELCLFKERHLDLLVSSQCHEDTPTSPLSDQIHPLPERAFWLRAPSTLNFWIKADFELKGSEHKNKQMAFCPETGARSSETFKSSYSAYLEKHRKTTQRHLSVSKAEMEAQRRCVIYCIVLPFFINKRSSHLSST